MGLRGLLSQVGLVASPGQGWVWFDEPGVSSVVLHGNQLSQLVTVKVIEILRFYYR